ncbi:MAG: prepilin-type N-terminal cleavage/methylation domain-containing protein [Planctomycetota bacterium]|nr:prepilin-type N-terminal cleavage/methylation domain-containing protein [Planctomycetota bacterium]
MAGTEGRRMSIRSDRRGFTLVELIVVLFIILLLIGVATPAFSQMLKTSRVQQAAQVASAALFQARAEAQRYRQMVTVNFGDDQAKLPVKPPAGVLPPKGQIELWATLVGDSDQVGAGSPPLLNGSDWYPYGATLAEKDRLINPQPITFADGVRILSGNFQKSWSGSKYDHTFSFGSFHTTAPEGEVKRHNVAYSRNGGMPGWYDGLNSYFTILVFDENTGEHLIIWCGEWRASSKPRILPYSLTQIAGRSGAWVTLKSFKDIPANIDK